MRILWSHEGIRHQCRRNPAAVISRRPEHIVEDKRSRQAVLHQRLTYGQIKIDISFLLTLAYDARADVIGIELESCSPADIEIVHHREARAHYRCIGAAYEGTYESVMEDASVHCHAPPAHRLDGCAGLEADCPVVSGIHKRVEGYTRLRTICGPDALTHVRALTPEASHGEYVFAPEMLSVADFSRMDVFRTDIGITCFLCVVILVGDIWLKFPYSRSRNAIRIACSEDVAAWGLI